jgi:hypothetical protein
MSQFNQQIQQLLPLLHRLTEHPGIGTSEKVHLAYALHLLQKLAERFSATLEDPSPPFEVDPYAVDPCVDPYLKSPRREAPGNEDQDPIEGEHFSASLEDDGILEDLIAPFLEKQTLAVAVAPLPPPLPKLCFDIEPASGSPYGSGSSHFLNGDRTLALEAVESPWNADLNEVWERHYESLLGYKTEHGDIKVPRAYAKNPRLGEWVFEQRRQLKLKEEGKPSQIDEDKKTKLDRVGFVWKIRERVDWNGRYEQLIDFKKEHGHTSKSRQV